MAFFRGRIRQRLRKTFSALLYASGRIILVEKEDRRMYRSVLAREFENTSSLCLMTYIKCNIIWCNEFHLSTVMAVSEKTIFYDRAP